MVSEDLEEDFNVSPMNEVVERKDIRKIMDDFAAGTVWPMARPSAAKSTFIIPTDLLDDIASRFLLDAPESELGDPISLCFLTELAYWFYLDEYAEEDDSLNNIKFDPFAQQLLNLLHCNTLARQLLHCNTLARQLLHCNTLARQLLHCNTLARQLLHCNTLARQLLHCNTLARQLLHCNTLARQLLHCNTLARQLLHCNTLARQLLHCNTLARQLLHCNTLARQLLHCNTLARQLLHCNTLARQLLHCNTLARQLLHCNTLARQLLHCNTLARQLLHCNTLARQLLHCNTLARQLLHCNTLARQLLHCNTLARQRLHCNTLARQLLHCNTLARQRLHCNTLARQLLHCNTLARQLLHCNTLARQLLHCNTLARQLEGNSLGCSLRVGIKPSTGTIEEMLQDFRDFKHRVPTYGGLLLNQDMTQVLLVQGFWHRASWGFPKGKINVDEEPHKCAIREVLEETGYDISSQIDPNVFLETSIGEQYVRLYIIPGVPTTHDFVPRTKGEIKQLKWFTIGQLPSHKNDRNFNKVNGSTNMFYMVMPFVKPLREWVAARHRGNTGGREGRRRHRSSTNTNITSAITTTTTAAAAAATDHHHQNQNHNGTRHSHSPATPTDSSKKVQQGVDSRKQQKETFASSIQEEAARVMKLWGSTEVAPRRREASSKGKQRKPQHNGKQAAAAGTAEHQEESQKFTFSKRGKGRGSKGNRDSQVGDTQATTLAANPRFRSYSWQSFRINKRDVMDAIDRVWSGVTIGY
ncbi:m7GpppN-mRNA hydrolase [Chionoecetes opilio]|uniref:mRNA-decapping enzyme 2 n=1 Tax=Chionoecetes opilio TaxID=41210 RepID=A0A8J5CQ34_CHIOP|nr:m7GpppN-mRNA hydrolase [Chionoecetes opilio]